MKAITVKYHGATNKLPARYIARDSDNNSITVRADTDDQGLMYNNEDFAAVQLCRKMGWTDRKLIHGWTKDGETYVFVPKEGDLSQEITIV